MLLNQHKISIIIRCYNEEQHIGRLLNGIQQQTLNNIEIIVVDSGSTDATVTIASRYPIKLVSIQPEDFSFGYSLNQGCAMASGEFLVFASAHIYPIYPDWLEQLIKPFSDEQVGLCYGKQRGNELSKYSELQVFAKWFPEQSNHNQFHPFCNNANAAIRRSLWQQIAYDESLTGLEDLDWAKRAIAMGYKIAYIADAEIIHVHEETPRKIYNRYYREAIALKRIFPQEHLNAWDVVRLTASNVASDYYHAWRDNKLIKNLIGIPVFRLMQFLGSYRGFKQTAPVTSRLKQTFYYPRGLRRQNDSDQSKRKKIDYNQVHQPYE